MSDYMRGVRDAVGSRLLEIPSVAILQFDERERVVLVKHSELDLWTTPGGAVEPREAPADAAVREMWEETGLHVALTRVVGVYGGPEFTTTYRNGDAVSFLMVVFEADRISGSLRPDGDETLDVAYFARSELDGIELQPWVSQVLENAFESRAHAHFDRATWRPPGS